MLVQTLLVWIQLYSWHFFTFIETPNCVFTITVVFYSKWKYFCSILEGSPLKACSFVTTQTPTQMSLDLHDNIIFGKVLKLNIWYTLENFHPCTYWHVKYLPIPLCISIFVWLLRITVCTWRWGRSWGLGQLWIPFIFWQGTRWRSRGLLQGTNNCKMKNKHICSSSVLTSLYFFHVLWTDCIYNFK